MWMQIMTVFVIMQTAAVFMLTQTVMVCAMAVAYITGVDGICDNCGMSGAGYCVNYVDANNDGVCDNYVSGQGRG